MSKAKDLSNVPTNPSGFRNALINGGFSIWQRGASVTNCAEGVYLADRWAPNEFQNNRVSRVAVTAGQGPISQYAIRSASRGSASRSVVYQKIESFNSIPFRGQTVTLSFWLRSSNATWVSSANAYSGIRFAIGYNTTTTDAAVGQAGGGFDSSTSTLISNGSLPTNWTKYSITSTVPLTANNIAVRVAMDGDGTATADTYWFELTDVQLERGTTATPFEQRPTGTELQLCQRYYERASSTSGSQEMFTSGGWDSSSTFSATWNYITPKRIVPTVFATTGFNCLYHGVAWLGVLSIGSYTERSLHGVRINFNVNGSGVQGQAGVAVFASASAYAEASAEL